MRHLDASISASVGERDEVRAAGVSVVPWIILSPISRLRKSESVDDRTLLERNFEHQIIGTLSWNVFPTFREYNIG